MIPSYMIELQKLLDRYPTTELNSFWLKNSNVLIVYLRTIFVVCATSCFYSWYCFEKRPRIIRVYKQLEYLHGLIYESDVTCIAELRRDRRSFHRLCQVLVTRGQLRATRNVSIEEMVALFLYILAHHLKNRTVNHHFRRSSRTISKYFHECIKAMIRCQNDFWQTPKHILENSTNPKWKWFKNCLSALDGTSVKVHVPECDKSKYITRKMK
ncbi:hypothetical protein DVH24_016595 [Malus domestica]|uniref:DDE Tnp4 domain-containing protein n=1 Tax=Malus domestica TaxID=3750 RepID=A0A498HXY9_MALDO|nr:hypothetical protein DVH24_016595 [Malus domestica]